MAGEQKAIAAALDISEATVSRSLRNHPRISAATRAKVAEAAVRMGFHTPKGKKRLKSDNTRQSATGIVHLGVLCRGEVNPASVHNQVALRMIRGMAAAARVNRATLHIDYLSPDEFDRLEDPSHWPAVIRENVVSGLAVFSDLSPAALEALSSHLPCVQFSAPGPRVSADSVTEDNVRAIGQLFEHLEAFGHTKIGMADFGYASPSARARLGGYIQAMIDRDRIPNLTDALYLKGDTSSGPERASKVADHVIARMKQGVRAWICMDDYVGYLLLAELKSRGIRVPQDVSLCGSDNFTPPRGLPKLTTLEIPFESIGEAAVRRLMRRISGRSGESIHIMFGCKVVPGESTGPVSNGNNR